MRASRAHMNRHIMLTLGLATLLACSLDESSSTSGGDSTSSSTSGDPDASVDLPDGAVGIGLDDLRFSSTLDRIVAPAGRTGAVDLIDPFTLELTRINGFTASPDFNGSDLQGVESADEGRGLVFAVDRSAFTLGVIDPMKETLVALIQLEMTEPDYVRWSEPTAEVWITKVNKSKIEVLSLVGTTPAHEAFIVVPGGVEGLAIDTTRKRAYTHSYSDKISVIDVETRQVLTTWPTGCSGQHGIPIVDEDRGFVFAGCRTAEVMVLDADADGAVLGSYAFGAGTTILAYSPSLHHFYLRVDPGDELAILGIPASGAPDLLGKLATPHKGHCATADDRGNVWVCDWDNGRLMRYADPYPVTE